MFVINKHGKPLMPCKPSKARKLLKQGKAKVVKKEPFTIQLLHGSSGYKQKCIAGIDTGSKNMGVAVATEDGRVIYKAQVYLRQDIKENIEARRRLRRTRRNRKTRYRKARFLNRKRKEGWLPPSIKARIEAHYNIARKLAKIIPISEIRVEVGQFDTQALQNPEIRGIEYQQGEMQGFDSVKEYVKIRDNYQCRYAKLRPDIPCSDKLTVDHIIPRSKGGTDNPSNLVCCCEAHNIAKGSMSYKEFTGKISPKIEDFRSTVFMNVSRYYLVPMLQKIAPTKYTFGLYTRRKRKEWAIEKSHINDAIVIAGIKPRWQDDAWYYIRQVRKKKRSLHEEIPRKGRKQPNREAKRNNKNEKEIIVRGKKWCLRDKVYIHELSEAGFISGFTGKWVYVQDIHGNYLQLSDKYKQINPEKLELMYRNNNYICERFISTL
ncbi:RNA-guided endonuclease IscB [Thermanaerosceptrum fracticalcis]|uniref:RNA-guided endonuclease IscB n=1 Tax=Thermanaerosceptrum fracticalcis TaxID=1712410 RepID=UPI001FADEC45|nr:RNA-guided endonuclease IscB [Thermanaerosceptrum fracticalcis]